MSILFDEALAEAIVTCLRRASASWPSPPTSICDAGKEATSKVPGLALTASVSDLTNDKFASNEPDGSPSTR